VYWRPSFLFLAVVLITPPASKSAWIFDGLLTRVGTIKPTVGYLLRA
jgi:hypothetical protein